MKLTREDIRKYGTEVEQKKLKETRNVFKKRKDDTIFRATDAIENLRQLRNIIEKDVEHNIPLGIKQDIVSAIEKGLREISWAVMQARQHF